MAGNCRLHLFGGELYWFQRSAIFHVINYVSCHNTSKTATYMFPLCFPQRNAQRSCFLPLKYPSNCRYTIYHSSPEIQFCSYNLLYSLQQLEKNRCSYPSFDHLTLPCFSVADFSMCGLTGGFPRALDLSLQLSCGCFQPLNFVKPKRLGRSLLS